MDKYNVGILGATGAVGREMLKILRERSFPVGELRLLASKRSAGQAIDGHEVVEAKSENFKGLDIVLGAAENNIAAAFAADIKAAGAVFVDNSSAFRLCPDVPLVVPEINPEDVRKHSGIIANPNCTTTITCTAISALRRLSPVESMVVSSYQAVSGAGSAGPQELFGEIEATAEGKSYVPRVFAHQIAYNVIPQIGERQFVGYTSEEMKLQNEGRRILHLPELKVTCTCVRVPVMRSHSISVTLRTARKVSVAAANEAIRAFPGCRLIEDYDGRNYPTPLDTSNQDLVWVGRVREDLTDENGLTLWCCGDQIRKGAAANAVQILKRMIEA